MTFRSYGATQSTVGYDSDTGSSSNPLYTTTYNLNGIGQMTSVNVNDGLPKTLTYTLDANGLGIPGTQYLGIPGTQEFRGHNKNSGDTILNWQPPRWNYCDRNAPAISLSLCLCAFV